MHRFRAVGKKTATVFAHEPTLLLHALFAANVFDLSFACVEFHLVDKF